MNKRQLLTPFQLDREQDPQWAEVVFAKCVTEQGKTSEPLLSILYVVLMLIPSIDTHIRHL